MPKCIDSEIKTEGTQSLHPSDSCSPYILWPSLSEKTSLLCHCGSLKIKLLPVLALHKLTEQLLLKKRKKSTFSSLNKRPRLYLPTSISNAVKDVFSTLAEYVKVGLKIQGSDNNSHLLLAYPQFTWQTDIGWGEEIIKSLGEKKRWNLFLIPPRFKMWDQANVPMKRLSTFKKLYDTVQ